MSHLKKKLDAIKASLPDPDESPIPSPSEDAPSPTGSESPFHGLTRIGTPDPELDGQALEEDIIAIGDAPSPLSSPGDRDNRDVEDMELSDVEEIAEPAIIGKRRYCTALRAFERFVKQICEVIVAFFDLYSRRKYREAWPCQCVQTEPGS